MAYVLFMDIVAYSTLPMDLQQQTLDRLQGVVRGTSAFTRAVTQDRLIRLPTGDGMALVFFAEPEAPIRCAIDVAKALKSHPDIKLRMGIHTGPVYRVADINANLNVSGGGINIAQRVMDCGDAGHILVSGAAAEVLGQVSAWCAMLHDLGIAEVKHGVCVHLFNLYNQEAGNSTQPNKLKTKKPTAQPEPRKSTKLLYAAILLAALAGGGYFWYSRNSRKITDKDTIVLADFANTTGDSVFDETLKQALAVQLEQSPFLKSVSEDRIQQTLRLMDQKPDARLTGKVAYELCQRTQSAALIEGTIASLGNSFVLGLKAVSCRTGESLTQDQARAQSKETVLKSLDSAASDLRAKLGESLSSVAKNNTPIEQATTGSLEALQAYTLGKRTHTEKSDFVGAIPHFQRAIALDSSFAMAYAALGTAYGNLGEKKLCAENSRKAFELRQRVSEHERLYIEAHYYSAVIGNLDKARQTYELWAQAYPRDDIPPNNLGFIYNLFGQYDNLLAAGQTTLKLDPGGESYANVTSAYLYLNRLSDAHATAAEAQSKGLDSPTLRLYLYQLAFVEGDTAEMAKQAAWAAGKTGIEDQMLENESQTAAYFGKLRKSRELSQRAISSATRAGQTETAAGYRAVSALREGVLGNVSEARKEAASAAALSNGIDVEYSAAIAFALAGDTARAQSLAADLAKRFPEDAVVNFHYAPVIQAQIALRKNAPDRAIESLRVGAPYELGQPTGGLYNTNLYQVYVRAEAYRAAKQGSEAAAEFQKILDHRGVVLNGIISPLAHLGLARSYALTGDSAKARAAYQDFLSLWKDANPDIPILLQAKSEFAKLP